MALLETLKNRIGGTDRSLKAGLGYTVGNMLVRGISFLTLPIFSRLMTEHEFGVFNVFLSYEAVLFVVVGLALHSSVKSANYEFPGEIDEYTSSVSIIYWIGFGVLFAAAAAFGRLLTGPLGIPYPAILMLVCFSFGSAVVTLYNERLSLNYSYVRYMVVALINSLGSVGLSLLLMVTVFSEHRDMGRIVGASAVFLALGVAIMFGFYRKARPRPVRAYWQFGVKYSSPIIPHGLSQVLLGQCDRVMIKSMVSFSAAGIYSLAGNINLILTVIAASVDAAWSAWFFEQMNGGKIAAIKHRAKNFALVFTILTVGLMAISPELVYFFGGARYDAARYVAVPLILDAFVLFLYNIVIASEYYLKKTRFIMLGTLIAAGINIVLNYVFILRFGYVAAAYTTLFSYLCYLALHVGLSRKFLGTFVLDPGWIIGTFAVCAASGAFFLGYTHHIVIRYVFCLIVVIIVGLALMRRRKGQGPIPAEDGDIRE